MLPRRVCQFFLFTALLASTARAAESPVQASLVAADASIQPGRAFTVALRLEHAPHWHTYWINPGTGYPTSLNWTLPDGFKAGSIQWPVPHVLQDPHGAITGNGYEGETFLPVEITPPATLKPGDTVTLRAKAAWLMCQDVCMPGKAEVELTLPVSADAPQPSEWAAKIAAQPMPQPPAGWNVSAVRDGKNIWLRLLSADGATHELNAPHFFADDGFIQYDQPQTVSTVNNGYELVLPISESADATIARLVGVLATENPTAGLRIDVPITAAGAGANPKSQTPNAKESDNSQPSPLASSLPPPASSSLLGTLALAFIGGLILNLMPCVFPVLGIKILGFVNQAGHERGKVVAHGLVFTAGVMLSFLALGGLAVTAWKGSGWGTQLQHPQVNFVIAAIFLLFALSMSGVFEIGASATRLGNVVASRRGYFATLLDGVFIAIVATPCSAPFLGTALGAALTTLPASNAMAVFMTVAIGLSSPYLLLSIFPQGIKILPKPGAWMETFKQLLSFPIYAAVGYFVWILVPQVRDETHLDIIFGLASIAMGAWFYGRWNAPGASARRARFGLIAGLALLGFGAWLGWPHPPAPTDITWEPWSAGRVAQLRADNRIIYVDFTARWCATCQANKKFVFHDATVLKTFHDKNIATLRGDWTNADPLITAELAKYQRSAVPFNLVYLPGESEPEVLPEILTPGIVLKAIDKEN